MFSMAQQESDRSVIDNWLSCAESSANLLASVVWNRRPVFVRHWRRWLTTRLAPQALEAALTALKRLQATGTKVRADALTVIDYTKPSNERRLWVFVSSTRASCSKN
jgi:hypothetical protein